MQSDVAGFFARMKQKKTAFIGTGVSHLELIRLFLQKGIPVTVYDRKTPEQLGDVYTELKALGADFSLGEGYLDSLCGQDVIFRTPGMNWHNEALCAARAHGCVVTSEMEVFFDLCPCKIYGLTGSDGKTTTTTIISEMLSAAGKRVFKGGNIGRALLPLIEEITPEDVAVVELSSFQLISMRRSPDVAVVTNVAPNHLDVHGTMEEYIDCKKNLILHQNAFSKTVLNFDNEITRSMAELTRGRLSFFSRRAQPDNGAYLDENGMIWVAQNGVRTEVMPMTEIKLPGMHNVENYLAAISAVYGEVPLAQIRQVAKTFGGVEHRIELVRELNGVRWYNDSIATSPTRTIAGLKSFQQKLILIAGGYDKKIPYEPLAPYILERVKCLILTGATAPVIERAVRDCDGYREHQPEILHAEDLEAAVRLAYQTARAGDVVTLSPASASFDKYPNFEARGNHFKALVSALE